MCIVCVLYEKGKLTRKEAKAALWETINMVSSNEEADHIKQLYSDLDSEDKENLEN